MPTRAAKLGGTASPIRGRRRLAGHVVELRYQGTGVLRALALVERTGGSFDLRSESVSRLRLANTLVSLFVLVPFAFRQMLLLLGSLCCINPRGR